MMPGTGQAPLLWGREKATNLWTAGPSLSSRALPASRQAQHAPSRLPLSRSSQSRQLFCEPLFLSIQ